MGLFLFPTPHTRFSFDTLRTDTTLTSYLWDVTLTPDNPQTKGRGNDQRLDEKVAERGDFC